MKRSLVKYTRWFDNLAFSCTQCGKCCKGRTNVYVNDAEIAEIADYLQIKSDDEFLNKYTYQTKQGDQNLISLKSKKEKKECIFLNNKVCSIYDVRPTQCRTYPFWPNHLIGQAEWSAESLRCEGISTTFSLKSITSANSSTTPSNVDVNTILNNMVIHQIYDRGTGPAWTYNESMEHLLDSEATNPLIKEYEDEFFSTHRSEILYETKRVRVIGTTLPAADTTSDDPADDSVDDTINSTESGTIGKFPTRSSNMSYSFKTSSEIEQEATLTPNNTNTSSSSDSVSVATDCNTTDALSTRYRRLEFLNNYNIAQTEVKLNALGRVDFTHLIMPVHKLLADLTIGHLKDIYPATTISPPSDIRIGVLGAGGCILPNYLLSRVRSVLPRPPHTGTAIDKADELPVQIDCVDPDRDILEIAEAYFDTVFINKPSSPLSSTSSSTSSWYPKDVKQSGLIQHPSDGISFLQQHQHRVISTTALYMRQPLAADMGMGAKPDAVIDTPYEYDVLIVDAYDASSSSSSATTAVKDSPASSSYNSMSSVTMFQSLDGDDDEVDYPLEYDIVGTDHADTSEELSWTSSGSQTSDPSPPPTAAHTHLTRHRYLHLPYKQHLERRTKDANKLSTDLLGEYKHSSRHIHPSISSYLRYTSRIMVNKLPPHKHIPIYIRIVYPRKHQPTTSNKITARIRSILASRQSLLNMHRMKKPLHRHVKHIRPLLSASGGGTTSNLPSSPGTEPEPVISAPPQSFLTHAELLYSSLKEYKGIVLVNVYGDSTWIRHVYDIISVLIQRGGCPAPVMFKIYSQEHLSHEIVESTSTTSGTTTSPTAVATHTDTINGNSNDISKTTHTNSNIHRHNTADVVYKYHQVQPDSAGDMYNYIMLLSQPVPDKSTPEALKKDSEYYYTRYLSDTFDRVECVDNGTDDDSNMIPFIAVTCKV